MGVIGLGQEEYYTVRGYQLLKQNKELITPAMEDYLEMIYRCCQEEGYARISKLSQLLNVRASSATKMVQRLGTLGLIKYERYGIVNLSDKGLEIGHFLLERHNVLGEFFELLGSEESEVLKQVELIEHNLSTGTVLNIKSLCDFFYEHPELHELFLEHKKL
jgi:Mn-dependent DtxR family transcriptional regulator